MRVPVPLPRLRRRVPPGAVSWHAPRRTGYDASAAETLGRALPMLRAARAVWLSTVGRYHAPHLVPTWFLWDGEALLVFSKPDAVKVRNLRRHPRLMVALGAPEDDFAVSLIEAEATLVPGRARVPGAFFAKYGGMLAESGLDPDDFRSTYTQAIRIVPTRYLAWRGRGDRHEPATRGTPAVHRPLGAGRSLLPAWA